MTKAQLVILAGLSVPTAQAKAAVTVFPQDVANPGVPCVAPVNGGAKGKCMEVPATFTYPLAPFIDLSGGGQLTVALRGGPQRQEQILLSLRDDDYTLAVVSAPASEGRLVGLRLTSRKRAPSVSMGTAALPEKWTDASLSWTKNLAVLTVGGQTISLALPEPLKAQRVAVTTSRVDELALSGQGSFRLDWEHGYAASVEPAAGNQSLVFKPQGFDAYYVSDQANRRDSPALSVSNGGESAKSCEVGLRLTSEIGQQTWDWKQQVRIPGRSTAVAPVKFPKALTSDIYHLHIESPDAGPPFNSDVNFVFVEKRNEVAGPMKFGLHDSDRSVPGFWPDALPIRLAHHYARWGYIVGPAWSKDNRGDYGLDPATPDREWNWNDDLDWSIAQGLTPYVCLSGEPMQAWMRDRETEKWRMITYPWGKIGGHANDKYYREWVHALVRRYQGKVPYYEIQNEPNAHPPGGYSPEDYVELLKSAYEEIHAGDPKAKVFGICGTGDFVPWMTKVFELGGYQYMDGVSIHTYTTPRIPDASSLGTKLAQVRGLIKQYKPSLLLLNSETGTYVAPREEVAEPIATVRLTELIGKGAPTLSVPSGWPNYALDETTGSLSIVRNATYNFAAGARDFVFFGWNSQWPRADWWTKNADAWGIISADRNGVRTPGRYALAVGVCAAQLESAELNPTPLAGQSGIAGAVFRTAGGGSTAVVWSTSGTRTAVFNLQGTGADAVSLLGQPVPLRPSKATPGALRVDLTEQPIYLHVKQGTLSMQPSPVGEGVVKRGPNNTYRVEFTVTNQSKAPWKETVSYVGPPGWRLDAETPGFELAPGKSVTMGAVVAAPASANGQISVKASVPTPDGDLYTASFPVKVRPMLNVPMADAGARTFEAIEGVVAAMNRPEQVAVGRPPALASLQEVKYWKGPEELSASVKTAYSADGLAVAVRVHDANYRPPARWPGVVGSAVELFFDFRDPSSLGTAGYTPGAYQFVLKPPATAGDEVQVWTAKSANGTVAGVTTSGVKTGDNDYEVSFFLPWKRIGVTPSAGMQFGLDVAVDGPTPDGAARKSQLVLFGTANNATDASEFGHAVLGTKQ